MRKRKRQRERERDRERDRERKRKRQRERDRDTKRERERETNSIIIEEDEIRKVNGVKKWHIVSLTRRNHFVRGEVKRDL
jgi:hypothetical protein